MSDAPKRLELDDHARPPRPGETVVGRSDPGAEMSATIVLRPASDAGRAEDLAAVADFARRNGLELAESAWGGSFVTISGTVATFEWAFHFELIDVEQGGRRYRRYAEAPSLKPELRERVVGIFGLRSRPALPKARVHHAGSVAPFWTAADLERAYDFPSEHDGSGQVIALVELGGGYDEEDLKKFFEQRGQKVPRVLFRPVAASTNRPCSDEAVQEWLDVIEGRKQQADADPLLLEAAQSTVEVTMDLELAGALAPGATLVVYMAPSTEQGIYQALNAAVHDEQPVDVIAMSWGEPETYVSDAYVKAISDVLQDAAELGITVLASSGDAGAYDDPESKNLCVNFPASSPMVLACGGSTVIRALEEIEKEVSWNCAAHGMNAATGGGISEKFGIPEWQDPEHVVPTQGGYKGRGLPDVAAVADPHNGCEILVKGLRCSSFGTSAVVPLWAALVARINQALGKRCGHLNPTLYQISKTEEPPFRAIVEGDNGFYKAGAGWNACTGLGTPKGTRLLEALRALRMNPPVQ